MTSQENINTVFNSNMYFVYLRLYELRVKGACRGFMTGHGRICALHIEAARDIYPDLIALASA